MFVLYYCNPVSEMINHNFLTAELNQRSLLCSEFEDVNVIILLLAVVTFVEFSKSFFRQQKEVAVKTWKKTNFLL